MKVPSHAPSSASRSTGILGGNGGLLVPVTRAERLAALMRLHARRAQDFIATPDTTAKRWYIIRTNPQCEARAEEAMRRIGKHPYAPVVRSRHFDPRTNRPVYRLTRIFVGYTFVPMGADELDPGLIRECDGVNDFVGKCVIADREFIVSISDPEIEKLRQEEGAQWLAQDRDFRERRRRFKRGKGAVPDRQVITSGAFEGFLAVIMAIEKAGAKVVTQAHGEFLELTLPVDDLLAAA